MERVEISKEYLEKIAGYTAINFDEPEEYIPKIFRELPEDKRPVFNLVGIDAVAMNEVVSELGAETLSAVNSGKADTQQIYKWTIAIAKKGIVGWKNYYDIKGRIVNYSPILKGLPYKLLVELASQALMLGRLNDDEELG
jgi:hypothetical protein